MRTVDPATTTYIRGLELAITKTTNDLEKQRGVVADKEKRYLDTKQKFVQAMGLGPDHYNHGRAREWAENQVRILNRHKLPDGGVEWRATRAPPQCHRSFRRY